MTVRIETPELYPFSTPHQMVFMITGDIASGKSALTALMRVPWSLVIEARDSSVFPLIALDIRLEDGHELIALESIQRNFQFIAAARKVAEDRGASFRHIHITR